MSSPKAYGPKRWQRARAAKAELEAVTGAEIFEFVKIDTSDLAVVRAAVRDLSEPLDGLILNAGGSGGRHLCGAVQGDYGG